MKKIILTYDYELFFGDCSGTVQKTLIEPTNYLMDAMDSVGFKGNFFIDYQMLKYLKAEGTERTESDYSLIEEQLKDMIRRGHRIELHIHPHWVDAKYNGDGTWDFGTFIHYSLQSFNKDEVCQMFVEGVDILLEIARKVDPDYKILAFRAGGWAIQPFDKLKDAFTKAGIVVDSSTMPGVEIVTDYSYCNFLNIQRPQEGYYFFTDDVGQKEERGSFMEVPISSVKPNLVSRFFGKLYRLVRTDCAALTDGTHHRVKDNPDKWNVPSREVVCTFSTVFPLECFFRLAFAKGKVFCYIDHPKDVSNVTKSSIRILSFICRSILLVDFFKNSKQ